MCVQSLCLKIASVGDVGRSKMILMEVTIPMMAIRLLMFLLCLHHAPLVPAGVPAVSPPVGHNNAPLVPAVSLSKLMEVTVPMIAIRLFMFLLCLHHAPLVPASVSVVSPPVGHNNAPLVPASVPASRQPLLCALALALVPALAKIVGTTLLKAKHIAPGIVLTLAPVVVPALTPTALVVPLNPAPTLLTVSTPAFVLPLVPTRDHRLP